MASSEKQMIPLENTPVTNEDVPDIQQSSSKDLVDVQLTSRPRRKVVIIAVVIAVIIVVAVAASLIGKYVSDNMSKSEKGSKEKDTGKTSSLSETKPSAEATSSKFQQGQTSPSPRMISTTSEIRLASSVANVTVNTNLVPSTDKTQTPPLPRMTSLTSATATSRVGEASSIMSTMSGTRLISSTV